MGLKKRLFTSTATVDAGYTSDLTSWVQVGTGKSWEGSGTSMTDLSTNSNNFTLQGGYSYTSGNNYVSLTQDSGAMVSSVNLARTADYSILCWYNISSSDGVNVLFGGNSSSNTNYIALGNITGTYSNESLGTYTDYGGTTFFYGPFNGHFAYTDGTWRMLTFTHDYTGSVASVKVYMNGGTTPIHTVSSYWSTPSLSIGRTSSSNVVHDGIALGQIRAYSVVLTAQQIIDTYNATKGLYGL
jgi:hypothetical protein